MPPISSPKVQGSSVQNQPDSDDIALLTNRAPGLVVAGLFWTIGIMTSITLLFSTHRQGWSWSDSFLPLIPCAFLAILIHVGVTGQKTMADKNGISHFDFWQLSWSFRWEEVQRVWFNTGKGSGICFETIEGKKRVVSFGGPGWSNFANCCLRHLPTVVKVSSSEAITKIEKTVRAA